MIKRNYFKAAVFLLFSFGLSMANAHADVETDLTKAPDEYTEAPEKDPTIAENSDQPWNGKPNAALPNGLSKKDGRIVADAQEGAPPISSREGSPFAPSTRHARQETRDQTSNAPDKEQR